MAGDYFPIGIGYKTCSCSLPYAECCGAHKLPSVVTDRTNRLQPLCGGWGPSTAACTHCYCQVAEGDFIPHKRCCNCGNKQRTQTC